MRGREFCESLRSGKRLYGTLIVSPSPMWAKTVGKLGIDYVFIDTEHIVFTFDAVSWMCRTYSAQGLPVIVRIPSPDPYRATQVLDAGATGIVAPYIETEEEVLALAGALKHRPIKGKKLEERLSRKAGTNEVLDGYIDRRNQDNIFLINVESVRAMENLDSLLAVPEVDGVLIGPHDLSCSLNLPEQYDNPQFISAVDEIIARSRAAGKGCGYHKGYGGPGIDQEVEWAKKGLNMICHEADVIAFTDKMKSDIGYLRSALGDSLGTEKNDITV